MWNDRSIQSPNFNLLIPIFRPQSPDGGIRKAYKNENNIAFVIGRHTLRVDHKRGEAGKSLRGGPEQVYQEVLF